MKPKEQRSDGSTECGLAHPDQNGQSVQQGTVADFVPHAAFDKPPDMLLPEDGKDIPRTESSTSVLKVSTFPTVKTQEVLDNAFAHMLPGMNGDTEIDDTLWKTAVHSTAAQEYHLGKLASKSGSSETTGCGIFQNPEEMKAKVRADLSKKEYNVKIYYKNEGIWRFIATNSYFEVLTLLVIGLNSIWLWIDTDFNDSSDNPLEADWGFQLGEQLFCFFFFFEWSARFLAFANKANCFKDAWFVFDSVLVALMVFETWIMSLVLVIFSAGNGGGLGNTSVLRLLRLMRLTRISRLARLLRACPELLFMVKGMLAATRGVCFTMLLLFFILYVFAIVMRLLSKNTETGDEYFPSVHFAMYSLGIHGALMDNVGDVMLDLTRSLPMCAFAYAIVIILAALTMMNMLVGVLCEVVSSVAATEKEALTVSQVSDSLKQILKDAGVEMDGKDGQEHRICKDEFGKMLRHETAPLALKEVGVDVATLVDYADIIFQSDANGKFFDRTLSFHEFMDLVLQLRDTNSATVRDVTNLRKFIHLANTKRNARLQVMGERIELLEESHSKVCNRQLALAEKLKRLRSSLQPMMNSDVKRQATTNINGGAGDNKQQDEAGLNTDSGQKHEVPAD